MIKKIFVWVLVLAVIILTGYFLVKNKTKIPTQNQDVSKENNEQINNNPLPLEFTEGKIKTYYSEKLGIQLEYPETLNISEHTIGVRGSESQIVPATNSKILITEESNKITISADKLGSYYALIYHKEKNETFEQSILRQLIKPEYRNNPCYVKLMTQGYYEITFEGDGPIAETKEGVDGMKKCGTDEELRRVIFDEKTGGFYVAQQGGQEPPFGFSTSSKWWPSGIKFIK